MHSSSGAACIVVRGLEKTYQSGRTAVQVLRGVDLDVPSGVFAVLVGPSGCGKTTLLGMLGALDTPDRGTLRVDGIELGRCTRRQLVEFRRRTVGVVFQAYNLMPTLTAIENLEIVLEPLGMSRTESHAKARAMLSQVGLAEEMEGRFPAELSGGEQQRVAIARALVKSPAVVLADEPTGNLDQTSGRQVIELMKQLNRSLGTSILVATHDLNIAAEATTVLWMEDGRVRVERPG